MGLMQRAKGKDGEREAAALLRQITGLDVQRRVRQSDGDSDLVGIPGWTVEIKRHATATRGQIDSWWQQACDQAGDSSMPLLLYRLNRGSWRAVWPISAAIANELWAHPMWAVESTPEAWGAIYRECAR